jgi:hypothetical protein
MEAYYNGILKLREETSQADPQLRVIVGHRNFLSTIEHLTVGNASVGIEGG